MIYSVDTCSFIGAWRETYPPDIFPDLWETDLPGLITSGELRATEEVRTELDRQDDELLEWAQRYADDLFVEVDEAIQEAVTQILSSHSGLVSTQSFRSGADPFVVALAQVENCAVVTEESPRSEVNPRIPDVCSDYGIRCIKMLDLLRDQGWSFARS